MPTLIVYRGSEEPLVLDETAVCYLDRRLLTGGDDDRSFSRRERAPMLFAPDGRWMLHNQSPTTELSLTERPNEPDSHHHWLSPGETRVVPPDYSEITVAWMRIGLQLDGSMGGSTLLAGPVTAPTLDEYSQVEEELRALLDRKPLVRTVMFVRYQQFISGRPEDRHPRPLKASEVLDCYPDARSEAAVNQAQREIHNITHLTADALGPWLVNRGILVASHKIDTPHVNCDHQNWPG